MGNRAVITTEKKQIGIYLHWHGGRDSVESFLKYAELTECDPLDFPGSGLVHLSRIISNYFGDNYSVYIFPYYQLPLDNSDNGTYIVKGFKIVGRLHYDGKMEQQNHNLLEMLYEINSQQPRGFKLSKKILKSKYERSLKNENKG
jgi:hypothetical protein